ncbi:hypothetical protein PROFUN_14608 [Planoprotostelium fungivorum]|uniref:Uncharacterized protein n=1 Tax=Planoprotostelium fungivorum TaxID=1890364 RepID=A0A2P6MZE4_9EUKA|nr:hypothetical protein PROFUN_14608 [Planoprotostelium fungivorum]
MQEIPPIHITAEDPLVTRYKSFIDRLAKLNGLLDTESSVIEFGDRFPTDGSAEHPFTLQRYVLYILCRRYSKHPFSNGGRFTYSPTGDVVVAGTTALEGPKYTGADQSTQLVIIITFLLWFLSSPVKRSLGTQDLRGETIRKMKESIDISIETFWGAQPRQDHISCLILKWNREDGMTLDEGQMKPLFEEVDKHTNVGAFVTPESTRDRLMLLALTAPAVRHLRERLRELRSSFHLRDREQVLMCMPHSDKKIVILGVLLLMQMEADSEYTEQMCIRYHRGTTEGDEATFRAIREWMSSLVSIRDSFIATKKRKHCLASD